MRARAKRCNLVNKVFPDLANVTLRYFYGHRVTKSAVASRKKSRILHSDVKRNEEKYIDAARREMQRSIIGDTRHSKFSANESFECSYEERQSRVEKICIFNIRIMSDRIVVPFNPVLILDSRRRREDINL